MNPSDIAPATEALIRDDARAERDDALAYEIRNADLRPTRVDLSCGCVWRCSHYAYLKPVGGRYTSECAAHAEHGAYGEAACGRDPHQLVHP